MSETILRKHRQVWYEKPVIRELYSNWYQEIIKQLVEGNTLELGGGSGNFKEFADDVVSTDVIPLPWIDQVADAQNLPFTAESFDNIVMVDVLHHIENLSLFFSEALRVLRPKGRIALLEPYISPVSWPVYNFLHPEPVDFRQNPLAWVEPSPSRTPFDSNQAFATILFARNYQSFQRQYPQFRRVYLRRLSFFAYPLSGGFDKPSLLPYSLIKPVLFLEEKLSFLQKFLAFRILVVLEKIS